MVVAPTSWADSRQVIEYGYDQSGNITSVDTQLSQNSPALTSSNLGSIRIGDPRQVVVTGTDLLNAFIVTDDSGLVVSQLVTTQEQISFTLTAADTVSLGAHTLTFSTLLGQVAGQIQVLPRPPVLEVSPNPIVLPASGEAVPLHIAIQSLDTVEHQVALTLDNPAIVSLSVSSATIPSGQKNINAAITLSALGTGNATLTLSSATLGNHRYSVSVAPAFQSNLGDSFNFFSRSLGVVKDVQTGRLILRGPVYSQLSIVKTATPQVDPNAISGVVSQSLNLLKGSGLLSVNPGSVTANQGQTTVTVTGVGLTGVDTVVLEPAAGATIGVPTASADGTSVSFPVTVNAGVALSLRKVILSASGVPVKAIEPNADRLYVGGAEPSIVSLSPISASRDTVTTLDITGKDFDQATAVTLTPSDGIRVSTSQAVNQAGNTLNVQLEIDEFAPLGPRVVQVHTATGSSVTTALPSNTLTITNGPGDLLTPLAALSLGITKLVAPQPDTRDFGVYSTANLSVVKGSVFTGLSPIKAAVGDSLTLTFAGQGLATVDSVSFEPSEGVTVSNVVPAADGSSVTATIDIAANADVTIRRVSVSASGQTVAPAKPDVNRFRVTPPQPQIISITPLQLVAGQPAVELTIRGQLLSEVSNVSVIPADDIAVSVPVPDLSGASVKVQLSAATSAARTPRVITVQTPGGTSTSIAGPQNTLQIVSEVKTFATPILATPLGVNKQITAPPAPTIGRLIAANLLGVNKNVTPSVATRPVDFSSPLLKVVKGSVAHGISPNVVQTGTNENLVISGVGLNAVTDVSFEPSTGITRLGNHTINAGGTELTLLASIAAEAAKTPRNIVLETATGSISFVSPQSSRLLISGVLPVIDSINPIQQLQGTTFNLLIRGERLNEVTAVSANPLSGLTFGNVSTNAAGTELTVQVFIDNNAPVGPRAIILTAPAGSTSTTTTPANTFTVVD